MHWVTVIFTMSSTGNKLPTECKLLLLMYLTFLLLMLTAMHFFRFKWSIMIKTSHEWITEYTHDSFPKLQSSLAFSICAITLVIIWFGNSFEIPQEEANMTLYPLLQLGNESYNMYVAIPLIRNWVIQYICIFFSN